MVKKITLIKWVIYIIIIAAVATVMMSILRGRTPRLFNFDFPDIGSILPTAPSLDLEFPDFSGIPNTIGELQFPAPAEPGTLPF